MKNWLEKKTKPALHMLVNTETFRRQREQLRPGKSAAGGVKIRSQPEKVRMAVYLGIKEYFLKTRNYCEVCAVIWPHSTTHGATEIHHRLGREGWLLVDTRHWSPSCEKGHKWIHHHPKEARFLGLLAKAGEWNRQEEV